MSSIMFNAARAAARRVPVAPKPVASLAPRFYSSSMHDHDPHTLETEKRRNLAGQQHKTSTPHEENAPGWNEYLASASEAAVKADQSPNGSPLELQQKTVTRITKRYHEDNSPGENPQERTAAEPGMDTSHMANGETVHAVYERDEIGGPLSSAGEAETVEVEEVTKFRPPTHSK